MGARIAVRLVLDHPQLVRRLVLESPSPGMARRRERADRLAADLALADEIERDGVEAFVDRWEELELFATQVLLPPEVREAIRAQRLSQRAVGLANAVRGAGQGAMAPVHEDLRRITAPTLVIAGARDAVGAERAADVARRIPGARLETIESAGHAPHLETPDEFGRLVADFLSTT
jgi:2-succinyl-6-hydroxy-2,4-cyclohexadiene-1-carboxylate synthase